MEHQVINGASLAFLIYCMYKSEAIGELGIVKQR